MSAGVIVGIVFGVLLLLAIGFILWVVPCGGMIVFLRRPKVRETVSLR
jgi:hypothetical protein